MHKIKLTEEEINNLLEKRSKFISIGSKITKIIEPKLFRFNLENIANVRNSIIISGTLATIGLLVLSGSLFADLLISQLLVMFAIVGFLLTIIFYSFYLKNNLDFGMVRFRDKLDENIEIAQKGQSIINDCLDGKLSKVETDKKMMEIYREIEYEKIRTNSEESGKDKYKDKTGVIGNYTFVISITFLILALLFVILGI